MAVLVVILLIIVIIFGVSSGMQSYATAQQAQAQIEVARVAQVNAWGNLITILTLTLVILVVLAVIAAVLWSMYRRSLQRSAITPRVSTATQATPVENPPQLSVQDLIQLEMLRTLRSMHAPNTNAPALPAPREEQQEVSTDDPFYWLR